MGNMAPGWLRAALLTIFSLAQHARGLDDIPLLMPKVKPEHEESYLCTPVRVADDKTIYITGFKPNATSQTAHHMLLFGCSEPGSEESLWNCGEMMNSEANLENHKPCKSGNQILYAWGMDADELELPPETGFRIGKSTGIRYLVLQVHYAHVDNIARTGDDSGIFLRTTETELPKTAGVIILGTGGFAPAHSTTYFEAACPVSDARKIHPFAFRTHTHALGRVVSGWKVENNDKWTLIGKKNPQKPQMFYPVADKDLTFTKGDTLAARCTMENDRDHRTYIGTTAKDEMCNFYIMYWVHGTEPVADHSCFSPGPPYNSWQNDGLTNIPTFEASTL